GAWHHALPSDAEVGAGAGESSIFPCNELLERVVGDDSVGTSISAAYRRSMVVEEYQLGQLRRGRGHRGSRALGSACLSNRVENQLAVGDRKYSQRVVAGGVGNSLLS